MIKKSSFFIVGILNSMKCYKNITKTLQAYYNQIFFKKTIEKKIRILQNKDMGCNLNFADYKTRKDDKYERYKKQ